MANVSSRSFSAAGGDDRLSLRALGCQVEASVYMIALSAISSRLYAEVALYKK